MSVDMRASLPGSGDESAGGFAGGAGSAGADAAVVAAVSTSSAATGLAAGEFVRATSADLDEIMQLEAVSFPSDAWSSAMMADELDSPHSHYLVLRVSGELAGYAGLRHIKGAADADVQTIAVAEQFRGRGFGRELLRRLMRAADASGARELFLEVREDNLPAQQLYASEGFAEIARRVAYYQPDGVDALIMQAKLPQLRAQFRASALAGGAVTEGVFAMDAALDESAAVIASEAAGGSADSNSVTVGLGLTGNSEPASNPERAAAPESVSKLEAAARTDPAANPGTSSGSEPASNSEPVSNPESVSIPESHAHPESFSAPELAATPEPAASPSLSSHIESVSTPEPNAEPASAPKLPAANTDALVLGIETSCDETGVGIVRGRKLLSNTISSSMAEHARFGGVVPEVAARAHLEAITPAITQALAEADVSLDELDAIAVTSGPGLSGALMVGVAAAKALAVSLQKPLYAVNHLVGHIAADVLEHPGGGGEVSYPTIALLVSGGHTSLLLVRDLTSDVELLGETVDDAAGEAFDKVARLLGLPYPGGPEIDRAALGGDPNAIRFPRGLSKASDLAEHRFDFSFSGLKTAVARWVEQRQNAGEPVPVADVAASFREAVVDVLVSKALAACERYGVPNLLLGGGVIANARLREVALDRAADAGVNVRIPPFSLCTDNGAMIAALAAELIGEGRAPSGLGFGADSTLPVTDIQVDAAGAGAFGFTDAPRADASLAERAVLGGGAEIVSCSGLIPEPDPGPNSDPVTASASEADPDPATETLSGVEFASASAFDTAPTPDGPSVTRAAGSGFATVPASKPELVSCPAPDPVPGPSSGPASELETAPEADLETGPDFALNPDGSTLAAATAPTAPSEHDGAVQ